MRNCVASVPDCIASACAASGSAAPPKRICIRVIQPGFDAAGSGGGVSVVSGCAAASPVSSFAAAGRASVAFARAAVRSAVSAAALPVVLPVSVSRSAVRSTVAGRSGLTSTSTRFGALKMPSSALTASAAAAARGIAGSFGPRLPASTITVSSPAAGRGDAGGASSAAPAPGKPVSAAAVSGAGSKRSTRASARSWPSAPNASGAAA
ncbi:hypothetical protein BCO37747_07928 [Burkholderia contaminans]|nr:hypothetical protein BCO23253_06869 [Burkholderia contaminans]VWD65089.1 hypothetical protein BCO37747_07928 [Burkholderia contaminans]